MRIDTVKKNLRTNHTVRWAGYHQTGTKRNRIVDAEPFIDHFIHHYDGLCSSSGFINKKYTEYFPVDDTNVSKSPDDYNIIEIKPKRCHIIKYDSHVRCCQMCGGTRYSCKALSYETNQYGKGVYHQGKKYKYNLKDDFDTYLDGIDDAYYDLDDSYYDLDDLDDS
jgi:hypothetical protein